MAREQCAEALRIFAPVAVQLASSAEPCHLLHARCCHALPCRTARHRTSRASSYKYTYVNETRSFITCYLDPHVKVQGLA